MAATTSTRTTLLGIAALAITVMLWSSFALSTRAIGETSLTSLDGAILRFATPLVVLSPFIPRTLRALRRERLGSIVLVLAGGLPHFLLSTFGAHMTSAGLTGLLVPGTAPLFVALLLFVMRRDPMPTRRLVALGLIVAGVAASALLGTSGGNAPGTLLLLSAGLAWAVYTVGIRRTKLDIVGIVLVVCSASTVSALTLGVSGAMPSNLLHGSVRLTDVALFVGLMGVGTGLLSTFCYMRAVRALGSSIPSVAGALSPVLTAVIAVPLLGEPITAGLAVGLALIVAGVVLFNAAPGITARMSARAVSTSASWMSR